MKSFALLLLIAGITPLSYGFDFYQYGPKAKTISGVQYPRNYMTLYRGTTDAQMDLSKAVRAMFRDPTANVESFFFSTIKQKLMGKSFGAEEPLDSYLTSEIRKAISDNGKPLDEKAAVTLAMKLSDRTFEHNGEKTNVAQFVNYRSASWIDWPRDIVFSTIVSPAAATYGDKIIVMKEKSPRALDLNFWNLINNGKDRDHDRDIGEFSTPGYVLYSDIDGYQIRTAIKGPVVYSFDRIEIAGDTFVLVFDGTWSGSTLSKCVVRTTEWDFVHCNYTGGLALSPPPATDRPLALLGVVALCASKESCHVPQEITQRLTLLSSKKLSSSVQQEIEGVSVRGKKAFYLPAQ